MHPIKIKITGLTSSLWRIIILILGCLVTFSVLETQTQGRILRAESQLEGLSSEVIASDSVFEILSFVCVESVSVVCGQSHRLTRLAIREVGFS